MLQLWVVAGPNGAGKSTLTRRYLAGQLQIVNPDGLLKSWLQPSLPGSGRVRMQAGREAIRKQEVLLTQGVDFAVETTLSGNRELSLLQRARTAGYKVPLVYIGVNSPDVSLGRIAQRVTEGGHHVPTADVDCRYARSMANLSTALRHVNRAYVLDNTSQRYRLLLSMEGGRIKHLSRHLPLWTQTALPQVAGRDA